MIPSSNTCVDSFGAAAESSPGRPEESPRLSRSATTDMSTNGRQSATSRAEVGGIANAAFCADGRDYDPAEIIARALELYADCADRIAVRCLRPLYGADGSPILNERGEQQRAVLAGVYEIDRIPEAAGLIAALDTRRADDLRDRPSIHGAVGRWHCYFNAQRVIAPISNRLVPGWAGTVRKDNIGGYTTLIADLDPLPGAVPGAAVTLAYDLVEALSDIDRRFDRRAMMIQQSGRGAYVLVRIEPHPLTVQQVMRDALRTLGRLVGAAGATIQVDPSVHDPARILRIAGTTNHKAVADPTNPAWILCPWEPAASVPFEAIQRLAAPSRPKLRIVRSRQSPRLSIEAHRPLRELFASRGWLYTERDDGVCDVRCPRAELHTDGRVGAILYPPREAGGPGWVKCLHAHCSDMTLADVYRALEAW